MITINETKTQICHRNGNMVLPELKNNVSKETHYNSDSNSSNSSGEAFEIQAIRDAFDNSKCSNGEEGLMFCTNPNCEDNAVICFKKRCDCRKTHKNCSKAEFDGFLDSYDFKLKEEKKAIKKVEKIFENLIDEISRIEDEIIKTIHGSFLTHHEADFVLKISNQDFSSLKGKEISKAFSYINEINKKEDYNDFVDELIEDIEDLSKESIKSFSKLHKQLENEKNKTKKENNAKEQKKEEPKVIFESENASGINSKIITEEEQVQTLKQFFTKKSMKSMKLLYRASENKFSMEKFYDKCSNIPNTLILIKTEFDKIIGGYTPLIWKKYEGVIKNRLEDPSLESFIFSVSEKEKLQLKEKENATYYLSYAPGPRFGKEGCADLWICDEANKKADSYVLGNMSYDNKKYSSSVESYERFVGGPSEYFTTKDWECFEVQFE